MKKIFLASALAVFAFLTGCTQNTTPSQEKYLDTKWVNVYYASAQAGDMTPAIACEACEIPQGSLRQTVYAIYSQSCKEPVENSLKSPIPNDALLKNVTIDGDCITLDISREYDNMSGFARTVADSCLAMSLCELEGINNVIINVDGVVRRLNRNDIVLSDIGVTGYGKKIKLYFPGKGYETLETELRDVVIDGAKSEAELVVEQLVQGPSKGGSNNAIPYGTRINYVKCENGICTVNFSEEFINNHFSSEEAEKICIRAISKTIFNIEGINKLQILIDGVKTKGFTHADLSEIILPEAAVN